MTDKLLKDYLGLKMPKVYQQNKGKEGVDPELLYGVELEIEGLNEDRQSHLVAGLQYHEDGSLRNNGGEFVTIPMNYSNLEEVLRHFFNVNKFTEANYSERTSVHVHANCLDMTLNQISLVVMLYQVLEKVLFNFIKDERDKNIFCVPLSESVLTSRSLSDPEELVRMAHPRRWRKYTALNLIPLSSLGTLEFRHMAGTNNVDRILTWANIIGCLFRFAKQNNYEDVLKTIRGLNTTSAYGTFMMNVFPGDYYNLLAVGYFREFLEEGVINMKCALSKPEKPKDAEDNWEVQHYPDHFERRAEEHWNAQNWAIINARSNALWRAGQNALNSFYNEGMWLISQAVPYDQRDPAYQVWVELWNERREEDRIARERRLRGVVGGQLPDLGVGQAAQNRAAMNAGLQINPAPPAINVPAGQRFVVRPFDVFADDGHVDAVRQRGGVDAARQDARPIPPAPRRNNPR